MLPSAFIKKVMVCVDGSRESNTAAQWAITLAKTTDIELIAVSVVNVNLLKDLVKSRIFVMNEKMDYEQDLELDGKRSLTHVERLARSKGVPVRTELLKGVVSHEIVRKVDEWDVDLLVLGELGPVSSRAEAFLKESDRILRNTKCSVIVIKNAERVERIYNSLETKK